MHGNVDNEFDTLAKPLEDVKKGFIVIIEAIDAKLKGKDNWEESADQEEEGKGHEFKALINFFVTVENLGGFWGERKLDETHLEGEVVKGEPDEDLAHRDN